MKFLTKDILVPFFNIILIAVASFMLYQEYNRSVQVTQTKQIGTITFKRRVAERKYSQQVIWEKLGNNAPIYNFDTIRTDADSLATINLQDGTAIELEEETMVVLQDSQKGLDIDFEQGSISAKSGSKRALNITAGTTTVAIAAAGDVNLNKTADEDLNVNVESGKATLTTDGKSSEVGTKQAAVVSDGKAEVKNINIRLISPEPAKTLLATSSQVVTFTWDTGESQKATFQISNDSSFSNILSERTTTGNSATATLSEGVYYWRVSAGENSSAVRRIAIITENIPIILRPYSSQNFEYRDSRPLVTFSWRGAGSANNYILEIANDSNFNRIVKTLRTQSTLISTDDLSTGTYYCRIKGIYNLKGGKKEISSGVTTFSIRQKSQVSAPKLLAPSNGKTILVNQATTIFNWKNVSEAKTYILYLYDVSQSRELINTTLFSNYYTYGGRLGPGTYRWKVTSVAADGTKSSPSSTHSFKVSATGEIKQLAPANNTEFTLLDSINFSWYDANQGSQYLIVISRDPLFATTVKERTVTGRSTSFSQFTGGRYYWKVHLLDQSGRKVQSSGSSTFYIPGSVTNPANLSPSNKTYPSTTGSISLNWRNVKNATHYQVQIYKESFPQSKLILSRETATTSFSYNITGLSPGKYTWKVKALQRSGGTIVTQSGYSSESFTKAAPVEKKLPKPKIKTPSTIFIE